MRPEWPGTVQRPTTGPGAKAIPETEAAEWGVPFIASGLLGAGLMLARTSDSTDSPCPGLKHRGVYQNWPNQEAVLERLAGWGGGKGTFSILGGGRGVGHTR